MDRLKPCPFCGGPAVELEVGDQQYAIGCDNDGCPVNPSTELDVESERVLAWNTRAVDNAD